MAVFNQFGSWRNLGKVELTADWQFFPEFVSTKNSTFWIVQSGNLDWIPKISVFAYLRSAYFDGTRYIFDRNWIRVYPKKEQEFIRNPYPPDIIVDPLPQRQLQVKFTTRWYPPNYYKLPNFTWEFEVFEKLESLNVYPGDPYPAIIEDSAQ